MQVNICSLVSDYFEERCNNEADGPFWFFRCGPLFKLKNGYRAFINSKQVDWIGFNNASHGYFLYFGNKKIEDDSQAKDIIIGKGNMVEFKLDHLIYQPIIK